MLSRACRLEPLEDRRLLSVASFQDGVFPTAEYSGTRDAPIFAADADANFGNAATLRADAEQSSTGEPAWSLFKWDLSGIPDEATINDVSLRVNITNTTVDPGFHLFEVKTPWLESEVTWNGPDADNTWEDAGLSNAIDAGEVILGTLPGTELGPLTISLTLEGLDLVQRWVNDPSSNHGFLLANVDNTNSERFDSREGTTPEDRPKLSIDFDFVDVDPPVATLTFPEDNGPDDRDDDLGEVRVGLRDRVEIQLSDYSLDDATITAETVTVTRDGEPFADVAFSFDAETDLIMLAAAVAPFPAGDYLITLNGGDSKIADTTGNQLPRTVFTVQFDETLPTDPIARDDSYETDEDTPLIVDAESGVLANDFDGNNPQMTVILVQAPQHGTIDFREDGSFTYAPETNYFGPDEFTYQISAPLYDSSLASVALDVVSVADVPIAMDDSFAVLVGAQLDVAMPGILANDSDGDGDELTAVLLTPPENGALTLSADGSFQYTPNPLFVGVDEFSYAAADAQTQTPARVVIAVHPPGSIRGTVWNDPNRNGSLDAGEPRQVGWRVYADLNGNGRVDAGEPNALSEADGSYTIGDLLPDTYVLSVELQEGWGQSLPATGPGDPFYTVVVESGEQKTGFDFGTYLIAAPFAADDQYELVEGNSLIADVTNGVLSNDLNIGAASAVMLVEPPQSGFVILSDDGTFQYSPPPRFIGTTTFRYRFGDGQVNSNTATVTIDVLPFVNSPPAVLNDSYATVENVPLVVAANDGVLANDSDADGHPLAALKVSSPANGTLTLSIDGSFSYSPRRGFSGIDSFTYRASDGLDASELATVTIEVIDAIIEPIAADDSYVVGIGRVLEVGGAGVLLNDVDPDDDLMWASLIQRPKHGELSLGADGSFVYTPDPGFEGTDGFIYRVEDDDVGPPDYEFISLGRFSAEYVDMAAFNGVLFFDVVNGRFFDIGATGSELWVTDGTEAGTRLFMDLNPGSGSGAYLDEHAVFNNELYFVGNDGTTGSELYKTDGTPEGTVLVADIRPGTNFSNPHGFVEFNDKLFFFARNDSGNALYKTDGTAAGTVLVEMLAGQAPSIRETAILNGELYFRGFDEKFGSNLWKTDGTTQGTRRVSEINAIPQALTVFDDHVFFVANRKIWKSDGTTTELVRDIARDDDRGVQGGLTEYQGELYFSASNDGRPNESGQELWKTDGSFRGTVLVADIFPGTNDSFPSELRVVGDLLLFRANDGVHGRELWRTDGTAAGTIRLSDVTTSSRINHDLFTFVFNDEYYFFARTETGANELWRSNGGPPQQVPGGYSSKNLFLAIDGELYAHSGAVNGISFSRMTPTGPTVGTVTIDVVSLDNNPPVAVKDGFIATEDTPLTIDFASGLLANDFDLEGDAIHVEVNDPPIHGDLVLDDDGSFTYTPQTDFFGADRFTYTITDGELVSNAATVSIEVEPVNDAPVAVDDDYQMITDGQSIPVEFRGLSDFVGGKFDSTAIGVSDDGSTVVGRGETAEDLHAFFWTRKDGLVALPNPGDTYSKTATDVSADGEVVVGSGFTLQEAFRWTAESGMIGLGDLRTDPISPFSFTYAISGDGMTIVGEATSDRSSRFNEAFVWTEATGMRGLGDLPIDDGGSRAFDITPDGSVIVGEAFSGYPQAFRWTETGGYQFLGDLNGGIRNSRARAVSDDGSVVVGNSQSSSGTEAFRWTRRTGMRGLGDLPGGSFRSVTYDVSGDGSIVVGKSNSAIGSEAFIWEAATGMRSLESVLENEFSMDLTDWFLQEAKGISSDGTVIVGFGINPEGHREAWIAYLAEQPTPINTLIAEVEDGVAANDVDVEGDSLTVQLVDLPQHGTVSMLGNLGSFAYTPNEGFEGIDQFTYRLSDGQLFSNIATVSIDVVRLSPRAQDDAYAVYEDGRLEVGASSGVLANDSDRQNDSLTVSLVEAPQHGTLSLDESGSFLYLPEAGFVGSDSFQYVASDGQYSSDVATVTISVDAAIIDIVLLAAASPTGAESLEVLPASLDQVTAGTSYIVEVWIQDVRTTAAGVTGGSVDLHYSTAAADVTDLSHGQTFNVLPSGNIDDTSGLVDDFGGGSFLAGVGVAPQWARLGYVEVLATAAGPVTFTLSQGRSAFGRFGLGSVPWDKVNLSSTLTVEQVGGLVQFDMTVVRQPTNVDALGQTKTLPKDAEFLHEWESYWVEVWVSTPDDDGIGIAGGTLDLVYDTTRFTATQIKYGAAFPDQTTGTIDDAAGLIRNLGALTTRGGIGNADHALLARVRFEPTAADEAEVDVAGQSIGPYDLGLGLSNLQFPGVETRISPAPETPVWAVFYDVDDSGLIDLGDFSRFAPTFGLAVDGAEPIVWWADFDKSGLVDFGDFSFFVANVNRSKPDAFVSFPENYPDAWLPGPRADTPGAAAGTPIRVELVAVPTPRDVERVAQLPETMREVASGQTFYIEVWLRDLFNNAQGITGGMVDMLFDSTKSSAIEVQNSDQFGVFSDGVIKSADGLIDRLGGGTFSSGVGAEDEWALLATVQFTATTDGQMDFSLGEGDLQLSRFNLGNVSWDDVELGSLTLNASPISPADLTGNGFVDFQDLTVLLANWNQNVSAAEGNLVDEDGTPVNFQDLTVLLAAWTGPGPAASPQPAASEAFIQRDTATTESRTATNAHFNRLGKRDRPALRRANRANRQSFHNTPLRRLQAAAVDRALAEESTSDRTKIFGRRAGISARR